MAIAGKIVFAQFTKVWSFHHGFYKWKMKDDNKKGYSEFGNWYQIFLSRICQSLYNVKPKAQLEAVCDLLRNWQLGASLQITVRDSAVTLKGSHRMGAGGISKKLPQLSL
jgi:hypothetical protein